MGEAPRDHLTGQKLVMLFCYFGFILSHNRGRTDYPLLIGVKGVIYIINLVWMIYLHGIE